MIPRYVSKRFFQMDDGAHLWLLRTVNAQYWRVAAWVSRDDLLQDGQLCWMMVRRRYPNIDNPAHRMALFKRIFLNHLHNLANSRTRHPEVCVQTDPLQTLDEQPCEFAELLRLISEAPERVRRLLERLLVDPTPMRKAYVRCDLTRETMNERLCALIGADPEQLNLHAATRAALHC